MSNKNKEISLIIPVIVKAVVTEDLMLEVKDRIESNYEVYTQKLHQLEYQKQYFDAQTGLSEESLALALNNIQQMEQEVKVQMQRLSDQLSQIESWELDQEVIMSRQQAVHQYRVGDEYRENIAMEIVIKDGIIQEIR